MIDTAQRVATIRAKYAQYGWSEQDGEWGHMQRTMRQELKGVLDNDDDEALAAYFNRMFRTHAILGLVTTDWREVNTDRAGLKWLNWLREAGNLWALYTGYSQQAYPTPPVAGGKIEVITMDQFPDVSVLRTPEPACGALVGEAKARDGSPVNVMFDTPRHDHYAFQLSNLLPKHGCCFEIGGGYGGTALQLRRRRPDASVVLCDLPETLYLAYWWLCCAGERVRWFGDPGYGGIVLLPTQELDTRLAVDVVFAAHSLSEMPQPVVDRYRAWITACAPTYVYYDCAHLRLPPLKEGEQPFASAQQWPETMSEALVPDGYRELFRAPATWPAVGNRYWEFLYIRDMT